MGRQVLVFNCDEEFDFKSMGRIFTGCSSAARGVVSTSSTASRKRCSERGVVADSDHPSGAQVATATTMTFIGREIDVNHERRHLRHPEPGG
jgi:dynein heavy chain 2